MTFRSCVRCHAGTGADVLDSASGEAGPVAVTLEGMPLLACPKGHRQFVHADFPRWLLVHLLEEDEGELPAGREQGLLLKRYCCGQCGERLSPRAERRETFRFDVALGETGSFRVSLSAPVYRCPACSHEQLHSLEEVRKRTPEALTHAFQAAGIPPA
jgi:hypothetical protein